MRSAAEMKIGRGVEAFAEKTIEERGRAVPSKPAIVKTEPYAGHVELECAFLSLGADFSRTKLLTNASSSSESSGNPPRKNKRPAFFGLCPRTPGRVNCEYSVESRAMPDTPQPKTKSCRTEESPRLFDWPRQISAASAKIPPRGRLGWMLDAMERDAVSLVLTLPDPEFSMDTRTAGFSEFPHAGGLRDWRLLSAWWPIASAHTFLRSRFWCIHAPAPLARFPLRHAIGVFRFVLAWAWAANGPPPPR